MGRVARQLMHGWNLFSSPQPEKTYAPMGRSSSMPPRTSSFSGYYADKSLLGAIYNRMAVDVSQITFYHARLDDNGIATDVISSSLNDRLTVDSNIDQHSQAFFQDVAETLFHRGEVAIVPVEADMSPLLTAGYAIGSMRTARIVSWHPRHVTVEVWDDREIGGGVHRQYTLPKATTCVIQNPFYAIMNSPSGPLQRLIAKLAMLDSYDEAVASGKLDLLIQLPHTVRMEKRRLEAQNRLKEITDQLRDSEHGIAYIDVSEKVIQLNRPVDNTLLQQIELLYKQVFNELGITPEIINGTATTDTMNQYLDRTIEAIATAIALEIKVKFLSKTARTQGQSVEIYRDPLRLIPISELGDVADKLIRNELVAANEFRPKIGFRPSKDPKANELRNPNMPVSDQPGDEGVTDERPKLASVPRPRTG